MNLLILYHLLNDLSDEKCRLEASMQRTDDSARQEDLQQQIRQIVPLLADVCSEVLARELPGTRSTGTAQEFETHLHRVLKAYGALETAHDAETRRTGRTGAGTPEQENKHEQETGYFATSGQYTG